MGWKAANSENSDAEYTLGYYYEKGIGCDKNEEKADDWFKKSFQHGNIKALKNLKKTTSVLVWMILLRVLFLMLLLKQNSVLI